MDLPPLKEPVPMICRDGVCSVAIVAVAPPPVLLPEPSLPQPMPGPAVHGRVVHHVRQPLLQRLRAVFFPQLRR